MPIPKHLRHHYTGAAWSATRARILARAGDRCETCGERDGALGIRKNGKLMSTRTKWARRKIARGAKPIRIQLGIAHMNHESGDDRDENLRALCRRCHLIYDAPYHRQTRALRKDRERPILAMLANVSAVAQPEPRPSALSQRAEP